MFVSRCFPWICQKNNDDGDPSGPDPHSNSRDQAALQVIDLQNEIPGSGINLEIATLEICDSRPNVMVALLKDFDSRLRPIDGGDLPPPLREPDCVASSSAGEVERGSRRQSLDRPYNQRHRLADEILVRLTTAVSRLPFLDTH